MKANAKYLFDDDFAAGEKPVITLAEAERRRAEAEAQAHSNGFIAGQTQARNEANHHIAAALAVIGDNFARLEKALSAIEARLETEAVQVAIAVASKLAPELISREPLTEMSALVTECFRHLVKIPHIAVHVGAGIYETAKGHLEEIAQANGFEGRLMVMPDAAMALGDCRIEWADGGVIRNEPAALAAIDDVVGRYVAARTNAIQ